MLDITNIDVKIYEAKENSNLLAFATIIISNCIIIKEIKIIANANNELFVAMPSRRARSGVFKDIVHPINQEARDFVENKILDAYEIAFEAHQKQKQNLVAAVDKTSLVSKE